MKQLLSLAALVALVGCNSLNPRSEATYRRICFPLMTDPQKAEYYRRPTWPERKAYLYEIGVLQKFEKAPPTIRKAILRGKVIEGMTTEQVLMSWGVPVIRLHIPAPKSSPDEKREQWLYSRVLTPDFRIRYLRTVSFVNGIVIHVRDERGRGHRR